MNLRFYVLTSILVITVYACTGSGTDPTRTPAPATATAIPASPTPEAPTPSPSATPEAPVDLPPGEPHGYPLDPDLITDVVVGEVGARAIVTSAGASVRETSADWQPLDDPFAANQYGWNCRTHVEYEATPAVDWYVPSGTPVYATMDGTATLFINTYANAFDYYGVDREPYLGNPDRARAPVVAFPGPGGGMGVYVSIASDSYRTDYGHLDLLATGRVVPEDALDLDVSRAFVSEFAAPRTLDVIVATWQVRRGDVIGYTGDAGYSEAPHLHYQIIRLTDGAQLCPTSEAGFVDGGWLDQ